MQCICDICVPNISITLEKYIVSHSPWNLAQEVSLKQIRCKVQYLISRDYEQCLHWTAKHWQYQQQVLMQELDIEASIPSKCSINLGQNWEIKCWWLLLPKHWMLLHLKTIWERNFKTAWDLVQLQNSHTVYMSKLNNIKCVGEIVILSSANPHQFWVHIKIISQD